MENLLARYKKIQEAAYMLDSVGYDLVSNNSTFILDAVVAGNLTTLNETLNSFEADVRDAESNVNWFRSESQVKFLELLSK